MERKASTYIRLILGIILMLVGIGFMVIPFIPIGWILIFVSVLFLVPYIPPLRKLMNYLRKKDKNGTLRKVERKISKLERKINGESPVQSKPGNGK